MKHESFAIAWLAVSVLAAPTFAQTTYPRDLPAALVKEAKIPEPAAARAALKAVPGARIEKMELEKEDRQFIYSYDLKTPGKAGIDEVHVDAMTGAVVSKVHESPAEEKAEAAKERQERKDAKKPVAKKPPTAAKTP